MRTRRNDAHSDADSLVTRVTASRPSSGASMVWCEKGNRPATIAWYVFDTERPRNISTAASRASRSFAKRRQPVVSRSSRCTASSAGMPSWARSASSTLLGSPPLSIPDGLLQIRYRSFCQITGTCLRRPSSRGAAWSPEHWRTAPRTTRSGISTESPVSSANFAIHTHERLTQTLRPSMTAFAVRRVSENLDEMKS